MYLQSYFKRGSIAGAILASFFLLGSSLVTFGETDPKYYAVEVSVQTANDRVTLNWPADPRATSYTIYRMNGGSWANIGSANGAATSFTDQNSAPGAAYEYFVSKQTTWGYTGQGYAYAGMNIPLVENRGKVILVVDTTYASNLASELARLQQDLVGDGWGVIRRDVARTATVGQVKQLIRAEYNADPGNVRAVFLFGRIAVPYSGNFNPDGHEDHQGAWPADAFYGDMDGNWTDLSVDNRSAQSSRNHNVPGDGKFDQTDLPSNIELEVGRVDLSNMTCFSNKSPSRNELDLLRQYLNKDHNFRHNRLLVERRGLVCDNFGEKSGEAFAASGWRNFAPFFGANNVTKTPGWTFFSKLSSESYLWSYGTGGGSYYTCDGVGSSDDFATTDIKSVFTMFLGSYFGDWDNESNFLRAPLGGTSYTLASAWAGRPHWYFHHMALGQTLGFSTRLTQNNAGQYQPHRNYNARQAHIALMGDPTLRMHPVAPVSNLNGAVNGSEVQLTWSPSNDSEIQGYYVYRALSSSGTFSRITPSLITATSFTDSDGSDSYTYMVRAIKLESSGSGSYFNASQGIFYPSTGGSNGGGGSTGETAPAAPSSLAASANSASQITLSWQDNAGNETGFKVERKTGQGGVYSQIAAPAANVTSLADSGLAPGTQYFYRVRAGNGTGDSAYSNEASAGTSSGIPTTASATFVKTDTATKGDWKGVYGAEGSQVMGYATAYPGYAQVSGSGQVTYTWRDTTSDPRALLKTDNSQRIASCWYSDSSFEINLNLTDGQTHRVALYFLDWDRNGRVQTVEILDAASGAPLHVQTLSDFQEGKYLVWDLRGHVRVRVTRQTGFNALVMGMFFDAPSGGGGTGGGSIGNFSAGKFNLKISGSAGQKYAVMASSDLRNWEQLTTVTLSSPTLEYSDPQTSSHTLRFYRAILLP